MDETRTNQKVSTRPTKRCIDTKYKSADVTSEFLNKQISEASKRLQAIESNIEDYRTRENIINNRQETETQLRKIAQLRIQQTNLKMNLEAIKSLEKYIEEVNKK